MNINNQTTEAVTKTGITVELTNAELYAIDSKCSSVQRKHAKLKLDMEENKHSTSVSINKAELEALLDTTNSLTNMLDKMTGNSVQEAENELFAPITQPKIVGRIPLHDQED